MEALTGTNGGASNAEECIKGEEARTRKQSPTVTFADQIDAIATEIRQRAMDDGIAVGDSDAWNAVGNRIRNHAWRILFVKLADMWTGSSFARIFLRLARTRLLPRTRTGGFNCPWSWQHTR